MKIIDFKACYTKKELLLQVIKANNMGYKCEIDDELDKISENLPVIIVFHDDKTIDYHHFKIAKNEEDTFQELKRAIERYNTLIIDTAIIMENLTNNKYQAYTEEERKYILQEAEAMIKLTKALDGRINSRSGKLC